MNNEQQKAHQISLHTNIVHKVEFVICQRICEPNLVFEVNMRRLRITGRNSTKSVTT